jgi:hypothetical protein
MMMLLFWSELFAVVVVVLRRFTRARGAPRCV